MKKHTFKYLEAIAKMRKEKALYLAYYRKGDNLRAYIHLKRSKRLARKADNLFKLLAARIEFLGEDPPQTT